MKKVLHWLDENLEEFLLVVFLIAMTLIMGIQVLSRYVLGQSLSWSEEITRYLFIWSGFLSVSYCSKKCLSIKIEQFVAIFPRRGKALFKVVNHIFELIFSLYMIPFAASTAFSSSRCCSPAAGSSILLMHSRSMHRFRTRSMRIFMLHIQRIFQMQSKRISLPAGGIPSYPPVAISFTLLFTKTSGISPLCTCQFVIPGGLILPFMILNLFCSNCFQSYTKCITIPYILDSFCFYSLWT